jgi:hypothetical protein
MIAFSGCLLYVCMDVCMYADCKVSQNGVFPRLEVLHKSYRLYIAVGVCSNFRVEWSLKHETRHGKIRWDVLSEINCLSKHIKCIHQSTIHIE